MRFDLVLPFLALTLAPSLLLAQAASPPCYEPNLGTVVGTGDDVVFAANALGFAFPYNNTTYTDIQISTNGFVYLGNTGQTNSRCCSGTGALLVTMQASIAAFWTDLVADAPGAVHFNALPGRAIITWKDVREFGTSGPRYTIQLQMTALGEVTFWYSPSLNTVVSNHSVVAGICPGNGAANPGSIDLTANFPVNTGTQPTLYEEWAFGTFDLMARSWEMIPNGQGGWIALLRVGCRIVRGSFTAVGVGCPAPQGNPNPEFYELFTPGASFDLSNTAIELIPAGQGYLVQPGSIGSWFAGFTNATNLTDDQTIPVALPFPFPTPAGVHNSVGLCSNGYLHLTSSTAAGYVPSVTDFTTGPARIFGAMTDFNRTSGGQIYSDLVAPGLWAFTWDAVAEFGNAANRSTWQIQIDVTGRILLIYQQVTISASRNLMVGFSRGGGVADPGNTDLSAAMPFLTATGIEPMQLGENAGPATIGQAYALRIGKHPQGALASFLVLGLNQVTIPLDGLGMTGCTQYLTLDSSTFHPVANPWTVCNLFFPNNPRLIGATFEAQGADFAPGVNPFGVAVTNGATIVIGNY